MKGGSQTWIVVIAVLMAVPGLAQAHVASTSDRTDGSLLSPLVATCGVGLTPTPSGSVDVNQSVSFTASVSSACTGASYFGYAWSLPANCTSPASSTYPNTVTSTSITVTCHPRYQGNVTDVQQATYYDYLYNLTVRVTGCSAPLCASPGDPVFIVSNYTPFAVYGEPRLLPGATGATSLASEVGVTRWLNTYFPLGVAGVDQTLRTNWLLNSAPAGGTPDSLAFDSASDQVFIANGGNGYNVSAFSVNEGMITTTIPVGSNPGGLVVADGKLFVSNKGSNNISVVNPKTDKAIGTISPVVLPGGMAYDAINDYVYVADESPGANLFGTSNVTVFNATSDTIVGTIHLPGFAPDHIGYDPSTHEVYVTNDYMSSLGTFAKNISAIYTSPGSIGTPVLVINVGSLPSSVAYSSVSHDVYVTNENSNTVSIISDSTNMVIKTIGVGRMPTDITTWSLDEGHLFMSNLNSANITVINTTTNSVQFNFGDSAFNYGTSIVDFGDLAITDLLADNITTVFFQNSTIPEYGSGLLGSPQGTQGSIRWSSNDTAAVPVLNCATAVPDRYCPISPVLPRNVTVQAQPFDTNGGDSYFGATNVTFAIHVYPRLQAGPLISNVSTQGQLVADAGAPITLRVVVVNGTGPGTYTTKWTGLPAGCATVNATAFSCTPKTIGKYNVTASVRDALGGSLSRLNGLKVYPSPRLSIMSASNRSAYTNTSLFVDPWVKGGAPPYRFCASSTQFSTCLPYASGNSTDISYVISNPGSYPINVDVTDAAGVVRTYTFNEQVAYQPRVVSLVGPAQTDSGQNVTFTALLPSGYGIPPLNVSWTDLNTGKLLCPLQAFSTTNVTSRCSFSPASSTDIAVMVTDSTGSSWTSYSSLIVHPDPTITVANLSGLPGKPIVVVVRLTEGVAPYTVCLTSPMVSCEKVTGGLAFFNVTYPKTGNYFLNLSANDSLGDNVSDRASASVYAPMKFGAISVSHNPVDEGVMDSLNVSVLGGSPNYTAWWNESGSGPLCTTHTPSCLAPLTGPGQATIALTLIDSVGEVLTEGTSVTVNGRLSVSLPTETLIAGRQGWLNGSMSGGTAPFSWTLSGVPGSVDHGSTSTLSIPTTFVFPGNYSLYFQAVDQGGGEVATVWQVSVIQSVNSQLVAPCAPQGPVSLHPMENGTYNLTCATGGNSPYAYDYAWIWADSSVTQGGSSAVHRYEASGHYNITVMVRDASGSVAFSQALEVVVSDQPVQGPPSLPCAPTGPSNLSVGMNGEYSISCATGGVVPYVYTWEFQDGTTMVAGSTVSHQFNRTGTFKVTVVVTDALGRVATSTPLDVTVKPPPATSGNSTWSNMAGLSVLYPLLLIGLVSLAIAYLAVRKYRRRDTNQGNDASSKTEESTPAKDRDVQPKEI